MKEPCALSPLETDENGILSATCPSCRTNIPAGRMPRRGKLLTALALRRAERAVEKRFNYCPECGNWVCDKCFDITRDCCVVCAGREENPY